MYFYIGKCIQGGSYGCLFEISGDGFWVDKRREHFDGIKDTTICDLGFIREQNVKTWYNGTECLDLNCVKLEEQLRNNLEGSVHITVIRIFQDCRISFGSKDEKSIRIISAAVVKEEILTIRKTQVFLRN